MRRPKSNGLTFGAIFALVLALTASDASANVLMNGDFEGPPPNPKGNGWFIVPAPYPANADLPFVGPFAAGVNPPNNMLSVGNDFGTPNPPFGAEPVGVYSDFDCLAPDEGVGSCALDFDYIHLNVVGADPALQAGFAPNEQPMVTLVNANGVASYRLPLGVFNARRLRATIPDCLQQTRVYFWLRSNQGDPPGTADSMLIDNVTCVCDPLAKPSPDVIPDSMHLPFDPDDPPKPLPEKNPYPIPPTPGPGPDFTGGSGEPAPELEQPLRIASTIILALVVLGGLWLLVRMWSKSRDGE